MPEEMYTKEEIDILLQQQADAITSQVSMELNRIKVQVDRIEELLSSPPSPPDPSLPALTTIQSYTYTPYTTIPNLVPTPAAGDVSFVYLPQDATPVPKYLNYGIRSFAASRGRCEAHHNDHADNLSRTYLYRDAYFIPTNYSQKESAWTIIGQIHENSGTPIFSLHINDAKKTLQIRRKTTTIWEAPLAPYLGKWFEFSQLVLFRENDSGKYHAKIGDAVFKYHGATLTNGSRPYSKAGLYMNSNPNAGPVGSAFI